jgi:hypothetical protein
MPGASFMTCARRTRTKGLSRGSGGQRTASKRAIGNAPEAKQADNRQSSSMDAGSIHRTKCLAELPARKSHQLFAQKVAGADQVPGNTGRSIIQQRYGAGHQVGHLPS